MLSKKISCFLPCRKGSERVPKKNVKPFLNYDNGLLEIKLNQLLDCKRIDEIILSTDDDFILEYAACFTSDRLRLHKRDGALASSSTSTDDLVPLVADLIPDGHVLWTHVTSPFITSELYSTIIAEYFCSIENGYDSLMTVTKLQSFLWSHNKPINYDREKEKWPRTQTLKPVYEVNSGVFLAGIDKYKNNKDRIGKIPYLYEIEKLVSFDIDWPEDFELAEAMFERKLVEV